MAKEKKAQIIDSLEETFSRSSIGILTDYRGLTNAEITALRRKIQGAGGEYKVVKNSLARFAAGRAGMDELVSHLEGPIAIAFGYDDITEPARVLAAWINETRLELSIKGGFTGDKVLTSQEVKTLSTLPSRDVLIAQVIGQMNAPITALVNCLNSPVRGMIGVLQAQIQKLEGE
ncbi:50S ribosomal protein L10 [Chloroflexota bacterium]